MNVIAKFLKRTGNNQQYVADNLALTSKSNVSMMLSGDRNISAETYRQMATRTNDGEFVTDILNEFTNGYSVPAHSNLVYSDHPGLVAQQLVKEMHEALQALSACDLTKQPEYITPNEKEVILNTFLECKDVMFQIEIFINRTCKMIRKSPRDVSEAFERKLRMERRI